MLRHTMSQNSSPITFSSVAAGYAWELWATRGQRASVQDIISLFKSPQKYPQSRSDKPLLCRPWYTQQWHAQRRAWIHLPCPTLPLPVSSLWKVPYGRCQSNWSFTSSNPCPAQRGRDAVMLSQGAFVLRQSRHFAVGLLAAEHWQSCLPTPNIKCHFNSQPPGKPKLLEQWTHAKQLL